MKEQNGQARAKASALANKKQSKEDHAMTSQLDIFQSLAHEKKLKTERLAAQKVEAKSSKMQVNTKNQVPYSQRKSRGAAKAVYNDGVVRTPGSMNPTAQVTIKRSTPDVSRYQFLNLTADARSQALHEHFEAVEAVLKAQLKMEAFDDFYSPQ